MSGGNISELNNNYPNANSSETRIVMDTKNILYQNFVKKYCNQMQVLMSFSCSIYVYSLGKT